MGQDVDLLNFKLVTNVTADGSLTVPASKYSRAAIVGAFEMIGGMEAFAAWALANQSEFYTKLFGKVVGKEIAEAGPEDIDNLLDLLDDEVEDVTDLEPVEAADEEPALPTGALKERLAEMAQVYAVSEEPS